MNNNKMIINDPNFPISLGLFVFSGDFKNFKNIYFRPKVYLSTIITQCLRHNVTYAIIPFSNLALRSFGCEQF